MKQKVFVGLSGGVDSSVAAALLKKAGYNVTGVFIKGWYPDFLPCDWKEDRRDAMRVCAHLDIPFLTLDAEKEYKKSVIDYMIAEYRKGRTPNPDVMCNRDIKFGVFLDFAKKHGVKYMATGHYAINNQLSDGSFQLSASKDKEKDQSYFLWTLTQEQLVHILFPIGDKTKGEVRALARKFGLPTADKKDSQGICFLGKVDIKDFLKHYIGSAQGDVLDISGRKIGTHDSAAFLTIGQRHGFTIHHKKTLSKPLFVVGKDVSKNTITVSEISPKLLPDIGKKSITLVEVNWISSPPSFDISNEVRLRYRQNPLRANLIKDGKKLTVRLASPATGISPGQSLVVYDKKSRCLGGGIIELSS